MFFKKNFLKARMLLHISA